MDRDRCEEDFGSRMFPLNSRTPEQITAAFQADIDELGETVAGLAKRLHALGDYRPLETTMRSVSRMLAGEIRVSGEMCALVTVMLRQQRRANETLARLEWKAGPNGALSASVDDFRLTLSPKSKGRWLVHVFHKDGYSHPWPCWQDDLETAKRRALLELEDARDFLVEHELTERRLAANTEKRA